MGTDFIFVATIGLLFLEEVVIVSDRKKREIVTPKLAMSGGKCPEHWLLADFSLLSQCFPPFMCNLEKVNNGKHFCCWNSLLI